MKHTEKGIVVNVEDTKTREYKGNTYYERTIVLEQPCYDQYTGEKRNSNFLELVASGERCQSLNGWKEGDKVTAEFVVSGSQYTGKQDGLKHTFMRLRLMSLTPIKESPAASTGVTKVSELKPMNVPKYKPASTDSSDEDDDGKDLPF